MDRLRYTLEIATLHLGEAEGRVDRQRELVAQMRQAGWDAGPAEMLLETMERTLRILRADLASKHELEAEWHVPGDVPGR